MKNRIIAPGEERLRDLLGSDYYYTIPIYQRDYSWRDQHVEAFLDDLIDHKRDMPVGNYYFFGTCYLVPENEDEHSVVDGQQRITTVVTFLAAVRDMLLEMKYEAAANHINEHIMIDLDSGSHPRLTLNERNNKFFQDIIIKTMPHEEKIKLLKKPERANRRLASAYMKIYDRLAKEIEGNDKYRKDPREYLDCINTHLMKYFVLLVNTVEKEEIVQTIFDTVNRRGMGLYESDYVKNMILVLAKTKDIDASKLNGRWIELLNIINKIGIAESHFLRHYLLAYHKRVGKKVIAKNIKKLAESNIRPDELVEELIQVAEDYKKLKNPTSRSFNNRTFNALKGLREIKADIVYPALLIAYNTYRDNATKFQNIAECVLIFFFRSRTIGRAESNSIEDQIEKVCKMLREPDTHIISKIKSILSEHPVCPSDDDFKSRFHAYNASSTGTAKYILNELNAKITDSHDMYWEYTLEHIMPQHISEKWLNELKRMLNTNSKVECVSYHDEHLHKVGNLTLLRNEPNAKARDYLLKDKIKVYNEEPILRITKKLLSCKEWSKNELLKRHKEFTEECLNIWKL